MNDIITFSIIIIIKIINLLFYLTLNQKELQKLQQTSFFKTRDQWFSQHKLEEQSVAFSEIALLSITHKLKHIT